jgi:hypothetical protein
MRSRSEYSRKNRDAFTILELLVSLALSLLILFLINRLFFDTTRAIGQGAALSTIIDSSRAISEQLEKDAKEMTPPDIIGGFLVIVNHRIDNISMNTRRNPTADPAVVISGETNPRSIRSDQLMFIRNADDLWTLTPGTTTAYANYVPVEGKYARIWYGHALKTDPDGTGPAGDLGTDPGPNRVGTNWILGRQALILSGAGSGIYVDGAYWNNDVTGTGLGTTPKLYQGMSDVSNLDLNSILTILSPLTDAAYKTEVYKYGFIPFAGNQRLQVNPIPSKADYLSWQIGQLHPFLAPNVSDFVVEFAADTNNDGEPDVTSNSGNLIWYGLGNLPAWSGYTYAPTDAAYSGDKSVFVFRHDNTTPNPWPYLIRVRYRVHDPRGQYEEFIGELSNGNRETGKWFEQIIKVNRQ